MDEEPIGENDSALVDIKPWWTSKIIWMQIVGGVAAILSAMGVKVLDDPETQLLVVGGAIGLSTVYLRIYKSGSVIKTKGMQ